MNHKCKSASERRARTLKIKSSLYSQDLGQSEGTEDKRHHFPPASVRARCHSCEEHSVKQNTFQENTPPEKKINRV